MKMRKIRMKCFWASAYRKEDMGKLEEEVNEWLTRANHQCLIKEIKQSISQSNNFVVITVWYEDERIK